MEFLRRDLRMELELNIRKGTLKHQKICPNQLFMTGLSV
jgi:hypothetical protein